MNSISIGITRGAHSFHIPVHMTRLEDNVDVALIHAEMAFLPSILVITGGKGRLRLNERQYTVSRGSVVFAHFPVVLDIDAESLRQLQGILITYRSVTPDGSEPWIMKHDEPLQNCSPSILGLAIELENVWKQPRRREPFRAQQLFTQLLAALYDELSVTFQTANDWIEQVLDYMERHYYEDLTREKIAGQAGISPEHFSRVFRKHTGHTFSAYLTLLRIRAAQQRLLSCTPKLDSLAHEVGYREGTYLSRKFKQLVGLSPTAYQRKHKRFVALNANHTACLLALGHTPELGVYTDWLESVNDVSEKHKIDVYGKSLSSLYETVAIAQPDVIINYEAARLNKNLLSLAPVLGLPFTNMNWREQFSLIADIADRSKVAEKWLADYDEQIYSLNQQLDRICPARGTAIVWEIGENSAYCYNSSYGRGCQILYGDIRFYPPIQLIEQGIDSLGYIEAEIEEIPSYAADYIFITAMPTYSKAKKRMSRLFTSEKWRNLEAVKNKRVYLIDKSEMFFGYDPLSTQAQLRELMRVLLSQK